MISSKATRILGGAALLALPAVWFLTARGASGQPELDEDDATASYLAELEQRDAAALQWHAASEAPVEECPEGTAFWMRDRITPMCATVCASDLDCDGIEGRCRVLDADSEKRAPDVVLLDDLPAEEAFAIIEGEERGAAPVTMCDPFWDFDGALDIDVVDVVE